MKRAILIVLMLAFAAGVLAGCGAIVVEDAGTVQIGAIVVELFT